LTPTNVNRVNAPAFAGATIVACHPPTKDETDRICVHIHHSRDEAIGVAAPSLTTRKRATPIGADCAVITARKEGSARVKDVLESISTVGADLQHTAVKAQIRIHVRCFEVKVVTEGNSGEGCVELKGIEPFVAYNWRSSIYAAFGNVSAGGIGTPELEVTHCGGGPRAFVASQPCGNAGGTT